MRIRLIAAMVAALALAFAGVASAAKISGGSATITPSAAAAKVLTDNGITVKAIKPATLSNGSVVLPIKTGAVSPSHIRARVGGRGGFELSKGDVAYRLRHPVVIARHSGAAIWAAIRRNHNPWRVAKVARLTQIHRSGKTATATVRLTRVSAHAINVLAGKAVAHRGNKLGTITVSVTTR